MSLKITKQPAPRAVPADEASRWIDVFVFHHFPQLDGLRGAAILLVVIGHVLQFDFGFTAFGQLGGLGVLLFFVLSGFLITGLLDREKSTSGRISLSGFYVRRVLRLFPALFTFLAVMCLLVKFGFITDTPWYTIAVCLFYVRNIWGRGSSTGHLWSLSIEEQFYMLWPWVIRGLSRTAALRVAAMVALAISVFRMTAIHFRWYDYASSVFYERSWFRFDSILIGCAIALALSHSANLHKIRSYFTWPGSNVLLWAGVIAWTIWGQAKTHVWYLTVQTIFAALILMNLILSKGTIYLTVFNHPVARWLGRISYSWYLWQQLFTVFPVPPWLGMRTFPVNVGISLLLAISSHKFIESPFLQWKERIGHRSRSVEALA
jgi:peptidoglycan/LPS O-acetylase OafA/YrhL